MLCILFDVYDFFVFLFLLFFLMFAAAADAPSREQSKYSAVYSFAMYLHLLTLPCFFHLYYMLFIFSKHKMQHSF